MMKYILLVVLKLHNLCYRYAGSLAVRLEGSHPKHRLMQYKEWFLEHIKPKDVVLDVGCNTGAMPFLFSSKASFVYGVEIDERLLSTAKANNSNSNLEYILADATKLNYEELRPVSVVTLSNVLEHIDDRVGFLAAIVKRLKWQDAANRRILIRVPMIDRDWITLYKKELGVDWKLDPTHFTEYTFEQFQEEMDKVGLDIAEVNIRFGEIYAVCC